VPEIHLVYEVFHGVEYHVMAINARDHPTTPQSLRHLFERISVYPLSGIRLEAEASYALDACPPTQC
jgi:hypothetical protein